jgi:hypothetical protein
MLEYSWTRMGMAMHRPEAINARWYHATRLNAGVAAMISRYDHLTRS